MSTEPILCKRDGYPMSEGIALQNTIVTSSDFGSFGHGATQSRTGQPLLIRCLKCPKCGRSITI